MGDVGWRVLTRPLPLQPPAIHFLSRTPLANMHTTTQGLGHPTQ